MEYLNPARDYLSVDKNLKPAISYPFRDCLTKAN
jgi:hypothetical protein